MNDYSNKLYAKQYQFTHNGKYLTEEQRDFYEVNGFIVFRNLVDLALLDECKKRFLDICNGVVELSPMVVMKDMSLINKGVKGEYLINKIQNCQYDEVLSEYTTFKPIVDIIESIIGPNITAFHSMLINKPPNSEFDSSRHPLHQDLHFFPFRPANSIVTSWTAMEKIDENNGCLFLIPGSHKWKLFEHDYPPNVRNKMFHGVFGFDQAPKLNLIMEKGDTVFFHSLILHGSGPNLSKGFRKAISSFYADSNCNFINAMGTSQENLVKEVEEELRKQGVPTTIGKLLKLKSRLIRGEPGNFQKLDSLL